MCSANTMGMFICFYLQYNLAQSSRTNEMCSAAVCRIQSNKMPSPY